MRSIRMPTGALALRTTTELHTWGWVISKSWKAGSTRRWRDVRAFVLARDGYRCRAHTDGLCDAVPGPHECTGRAELRGPHAGHAHHVKGRAVTGDDPRWITAACAPCNLHIGSPERHSPEPKRVSRW